MARDRCDCGTPRRPVRRAVGRAVRALLVGVAWGGLAGPRSAESCDAVGRWYAELAARVPCCPSGLVGPDVRPRS